MTDRPLASAYPGLPASLLAGLVCAAAVAALGLTGSSWTVPAGTVVSGLTAVAGAAAIFRTARPLRRAEAFRALLGAAALVWGAGQVVVAPLVLAGETYPTTGDLISLIAGPLVIVGLVLVPHRSEEPFAGARLACDALVTGGAAAALTWRLGFVDYVDPATPGGWLSVAILLVEFCVVALMTVAALRDGEPGLTAAATGVAVFVAADVWAHRVVVSGGSWPWGAMALTCLAWPLVCWGLVRLGAHAPDRTDADTAAGERRRTVVAGGVTAVLLGGACVTAAVQGTVDPVTCILFGVVVLALGAREVVVSRQSASLLRHVREIAFSDALTGLGNRHALLDQLNRPSPHRRWLMTVDLDNFKSVNRLLGHSGGDELLVEVARRLESCSAEVGTAFRLGGDEFAVLCATPRAETERLARRLVAAVRVAALTVPGVGRVAISGSVGLAEVKPAEQQPDPLVAMAESAAALQQAKAGGRDRCVVYEGTVAEEYDRRRRVEVRLREALRTAALEVHAQPVVELATRRVVGLEYLARWTDEELGAVSPAEFIEIAEATSLIVPLGVQVLDLALRDAADRRLIERDITVAVNVSPVQLRVPGFAEHVLGRLVYAGIPASRLVLEMTEQVFVTEDDSAMSALDELVAGGVVVAVDDFGAGSASLGYLRRIPGRILKLDRSLVSAMLRDLRARAIVTSMARLGAETGLDVVAEGVEDEATALACAEAGITYAQGWLFGRPVPLDQLEQVLGDRRDLSAR